MLRLWLALGILGAQTGVPFAASNGAAVDPGASAAAPGPPINQSHITATGQTVPRAGLPQSGGETPLDRSIERQNDRIDNRICQGC